LQKHWSSRERINLHSGVCNVFPFSTCLIIPFPQSTTLLYCFRLFMMRWKIVEKHLILE
jgi:hypothetical protein